MRFQRETSFIFYFYFGSVSRETDAQMSVFFWIFWHQKIKLADGFMRWNWHKIMKPPDSVRKKKMKLTARGFAAAVSFIFFPDRTGRFHNFSQFHSWNHSQFHFLSQKIRKNRHFTSVSRETDQKKRRFLAKTNQVKQCVSLQSKANQASKATQAIKAKQSKQTKAKQAF